MRDYGALERRLMLAQLHAVPVRRLAVSDTVQSVTASVPRSVSWARVAATAPRQRPDASRSRGAAGTHRLMAIADAAPERAVALGVSALLPACEDALEAYLEGTCSLTAPSCTYGTPLTSHWPGAPLRSGVGPAAGRAAVLTQAGPAARGGRRSAVAGHRAHTHSTAGRRGSDTGSACRARLERLPGCHCVRGPQRRCVGRISLTA
jgi:hypothetical protein